MKKRTPLVKLLLSGLNGIGEEMLFPVTLIASAFLITAVLFALFHYVN